MIAPALLLVACAHLDQRTAVDLENEAEHHRAMARQAGGTVQVAESTRPVPSASESVSQPAVQQYAEGRAAYEMQAAQRAQDAAQRIRDGAERLCRNLPEVERVSCPIPAEASVERTGRMVRILPSGGLSAESLRAQVDCAMAQAKVDHPPDEQECPLLVPGSDVRVIDRPSGVRIEIVAPDEISAEEVRRRARLLLNHKK